MRVKKTNKIGSDMKKTAFLICSLAGVLLAGCVFGPDEIDSSPDITLSVLEKKMLEARDPRGVFLNAKSYVQKQILTARGVSRLVEVKFLAPDKYKVVTMVDNAPGTAYILNGDSAWYIDYPKKMVVPITGDLLQQVKTLTRLGDPDDSYQDLFAQVELKLTKIGDNEYYKMICYSKIKDQPPYILYIGKHNFLLHRITIPAPRNFSSTVLRYGLYEGVMIPEETEIDNDGTVERSKINFNKLNAEIDPAEFLPPVFSPGE